MIVPFYEALPAVDNVMNAQTFVSDFISLSLSLSLAQVASKICYYHHRTGRNSRDIINASLSRCAQMKKSILIINRSRESERIFSLVIVKSNVCVYVSASDILIDVTSGARSRE
jgi:hypothetical protein